MADFSESDYGEGDYGDGFYSYLPITLFDGSARIAINVWSNLAFIRIISFAANVNLPIYCNSWLVYIAALKSSVSLPFDVASQEYIGRYWKPDEPIGEWIPEFPPDGGWAASPKGEGPWIPRGPDLRPNKPW